MLKSYINYLQNVLGDDYIVVEEEKTDIDYDKDKTLTIVSQFNGINYRSCVLYNLQVTFFTNNINKTMNELREFSWINNDNNLSTDIFSYIRQLITQPINNSNFTQVRNEYIGTITMNITLICSLNLTDVKSISIDGELINPTQAVITYQSVPDTQRNNEEELNSTNINETSLTCQLIFPADNTTLYRKTRNIMFGKLPKDTTFDFKIVFTDDVEYVLTFKLMTDALSFERSTLTTTSITFIH